jgi:flagellar basal-body rod protein FlgB
MTIGNDFSKTVDILKRAMDASLERRDVIADNIANADVPNFKRSTVSFEAQLGRVLKAADEKPVLELAQSDPRHLTNVRTPDYRQVEPVRTVDYLTTAKANGNNVDAEEELMLAMNNQMMYTMLAQAEAFEFGQINLVLR